jgi:FixJ family two-component response regulator
MADMKPFVAVVDDDQSVRKALARLLTANLYTAETYGSAQEFLESLKVRRPQCLVLDLHMPDFGGLDLQLYLNRNGIKIPTVVVTGHNESGLRQQCKDAGAGAFLVKPLTSAALLGAIDRVAAGSVTLN